MLKFMQFHNEDAINNNLRNPAWHDLQDEWLEKTNDQYQAIFAVGVDLGTPWYIYGQEYEFNLYAPTILNDLTSS